MPERTAAQEYEWLISREEHRKPIDAFFDGAIQTIRASAETPLPLPENRLNILELGPGPLTDLRDALQPHPGVKWYIAADTRPVGFGHSLEPMWTDERRLPWRDGAFDHVLAREVFEHVFHLQEMIAEVLRVLTPGGTLWFSTPFMYLLHDVEPENGGDFWRLSPPGWERLLDEVGFSARKITTARELFGSWQCPISVLGWARK